tara:strand:- start:338 stop:1126 length:789 start_codon:yes stop_codon:yes gene_type:complete
MKKFFLNERIIISIILLNSVLIFLEGFVQFNEYELIFENFHYFFLIIYILELIFKIQEFGFKNYIKEGLNKLDFLLVIISFPELFALISNLEITDLSFLFTLRSIRLIRIIRLFRVVAVFESSKYLFNGVQRALKSSYLIIFIFVVVNFIFALLSHNLFSNIAPEYFGDPLTSFYSIFKIFTIEGWYEIPDIVTENITNPVKIWLVRLYFVIVLFIGGIFGLSIINSVFVEGVINNDKDYKENDKLDEIISRLNSIEKKIKK